MKGLSDTDLKILRILQYNPKIKYNDLAQTLKVSPPTAKAKITSLQERKILHSSFAVHSPEALGLKRYKTVLNANNRENLSIIEKALDIHPFTHYRSRVYSTGMAIYADFDIPGDVLHLLESFLDALSDMEIIDSYEAAGSTGIRAATVPDFSVWNPKDISWSYDWKQWEDQLDIPDESIKIPEPRPDQGPFDELTLSLLSDVTKNADERQIEYVKRYDSPKSTISKKIDYIQKNIITHIGSHFDRRYFDLNTFKCLYTRCNDVERNYAVLRTLLGDYRPPFRASIDVVENGFFLYVNLPAYHESQLVFTILDKFSDIQILTLDIAKAVLYPFYKENYDLKKKAWKKDKNYIVDDPISVLKKYLSS